MTVLWSLLYSLWCGLFRDCFGKDGYNLPVLKHRAVQHILNVAVSLVFFKFALALSWFASVCMTAAIAYFWSTGHGSCYDIGTAGKPDEKMKKRYEKTLGWSIASKLIPEKNWYNPCFDALLLSLRYSLPCVLMLPFCNPLVLLTGLVVSSLYCFYRYLPEDSVLKNKRILDVEIFAGLVSGLFFAFTVYL